MEELNSYEKLKKMVEDMAPDAEKFHSAKGNAAAGTRVRKGLMEVKNFAHEYRKEITEKSK